MITKLEEIARAALDGEALATGSLLQDWLASKPALTALPPPSSDDPRIGSLAAALVEMLAERLDQSPPPWAATIGPAPEPTHLLRSALRMKHLRELCETTAPLPLRRRIFTLQPIIWKPSDRAIRQMRHFETLFRGIGTHGRTSPRLYFNNLIDNN